MSEAENVEIIRRLYDEFLSKPERLVSQEVLAFFDPDVEIQQDPELVGTAGTFRGHAGVAGAAQEVFAVFRDIHWVPVRLEGRGDDVVATVESRGHGRTSGIDVRAPTVHTWTLRNGRIVRWHVHIDHSA